MKKIALYLLAAVLLAALVLGGVWLRHQRQQQLAALPPAETAAWAVHTAKVRSATVTRGFPALALVKGAQEVDVAPRINGLILAMGPREGHSVKQGDVLARIDTRELLDRLSSLQAKRAAAVADMQRKRLDLARSEKLLREHSVSQAQVDQQRAAAKAARETVRALEKQIQAEQVRLSYALVTAPFDGVIAARRADPGDLAKVGKPLYRLIDTSGARVEVRLPENIIGEVHPGTGMVLRRGGKELRVSLKRVFPALDQRALGRAEADLEALPVGVQPGGLIAARVILETAPLSPVVPADAFLAGATPERGWVFRLSKDDPPRIQRLPVRVRLQGKQGIALEGGLEPGDQVVIAHENVLLKLRDGDTVRAIEEPRS